MESILFSRKNIPNTIYQITIGSIIFIAAYFMIFGYYNHLQQKEQDHLHELAAISKTLALQIDGDVYERLLAKYPDKDQIKFNSQDSDYLQIHNQLKKAAQQNDRKSPIYILTKKKKGKGFFFGVSSSEEPYFRHEYSNFPPELANQFNSGGKITCYEDDHGTWLSAFTPIHNSQGLVVGVVQVDNVFSNFKASAQAGLLKDFLISLAIVFLISLLLKHYLRKIVRLMKEKEIAENQAEVKAKFLSTMSHEIRTPMNAVIGLTNVLLRDQPREDQLENLNTLKFSADMLLSLINDILDYSKIEAGKISFENIDFDLRQLITNINKTLLVKAKEKQIDLRMEIEDSIPELVIGDPVRISQIITNLISNAIKFTSEGYVAIQLKLLQKQNKKATIRFSIKDTGIGISQSKFEEIFNSFSQADSDTTRKFGGTGLGLSITKKLLELQNSQIKLESSIGNGSTFYFDLTMPVSEKTEDKKISTKTLESPLQNFEGIEILLVEDNKINVMVAKKFLSKWGLKVDVAENGQIAVDKAQQKDYKLILMDLDMPVMDGYEATQQIRKLSGEKYQSLPIIALSASAVADYKRNAQDAGMNDFITKPFQPHQLNKTISQYLSVPV